MKVVYNRLMGRSDIWYSPLFMTNIQPTPNSGSERTHKDMNKWVDEQIDVFTRYIVTYRREGRS